MTLAYSVSYCGYPPFRQCSTGSSPSIMAYSNGDSVYQSVIPCINEVTG